MSNMKGKGSGWHNESQRHRMSAYGVKTGNMGASGREVVDTYEVFKFDELPQHIKDKVMQKMWDSNINYEWWEIDGLLDLSGDEIKALKVKLSKEWWKSDKPKDKRGNIIGEYPAHTGLIKYKISEFDIDRLDFIKYENIEITDDEIFRKFLGIPKDVWEKSEYYFYNPISDYNTQIKFESRLYEDLTDRELKILDKAGEIWDDKVHESLTSLKSNYDYLTSEEAIIDSIKANEYEFTEDGDIYG